MSILLRKGVTRYAALSLFLFSALLLALPARVAWAHGGGVPRLTNAEAGPYWASVWTQPDPLRVGQAHITVAVSEPVASAASRREAGPPVLDASVQVRFEPLDNTGEAVAAAATREGASNKLYYEADLELTQAGRWQVSVLVDGPAGSGSAGFETDVATPAAFNMTWVAVLGAAALVGVWLIHKVRARHDGDLRAGSKSQEELAQSRGEQRTVSR